MAMPLERPLEIEIARQASRNLATEAIEAYEALQLGVLSHESPPVPDWETGLPDVSFYGSEMAISNSQLMLLCSHSSTSWRDGRRNCSIYSGWRAHLGGRFYRCSRRVRIADCS
jgi:hypothetical protein